jgi:hypothetical protein
VSHASDTIRALLDLRFWLALDLDADGRVLAGHDDLGSMQLVEIAADGTVTPLTDLPSPCRGRYVPGRRQVVVEHDEGGNENYQLSLLDLTELPSAPVGPGGLTPLVRDPEHLHVLLDVSADQVVYCTNRRNGVDMDVVLRRGDHGLARHGVRGGDHAQPAAELHDRGGRVGG